MSHDTLTGPNAPSEELQTYLNLRKYCLGSDIPVTFIPTAHNVFRALPAFFRIILDTESRHQVVDYVRLGFPDRSQPLCFRDLPAANSLTRAETIVAYNTVRVYLKRHNPELWNTVKLRRQTSPAQTNVGVVDSGNQAPAAFTDDQTISPDIVLPYSVLHTWQRARFVAEDIVFGGPDAAAIRLVLSLDHLWHAGCRQRQIIRRSTTGIVYHRIEGTWVAIGNTGTCQERGYENEAQEFESERINIERLRWGRSQTRDTYRPVAADDHGDNNEPAVTEDHERALLYPWWIIPPETRVYSERRLRARNRLHTIWHAATEVPLERRSLPENVMRVLQRVYEDTMCQAERHAALGFTPHSP